MNRLLAIISATLLSSCALFGSVGPDLGALADEVALYRADVHALAPLASPDTQAKLVKLDAAIVKVEMALRAADQGGPLADVYDYARAALTIADMIALELAPDSDLRFAVAIARVVLNHIATGQLEEAAAVE